jgi:hypothetical protein
MEYNQTGVHHGDILLCRKEEVSMSESLKTGKIYVVVSKDQVIIRRLKSVDAKKMSMISDDPNYNNIEIPINESLLEVWTVKGVFSTYLNPPKMVDEKVMRLENTMEAVMSRLEKLEKK